MTRATFGQCCGDDESTFITLFGGVEAGYLIVKARGGFIDGHFVDPLTNT